MSTKIKKNYNVSEHPIFEVKDDRFDAEPRIVKKIYEFINNVSEAQITIAITGEWGIGKSSVINLLKNKLTKTPTNIIITFEALLEGKFEICEIIELFYLKLHQRFKNKEIKEVLKKSFKSAAILSRFKIAGSLELDANIIGIPGGKVGLDAEYNWADNIDALFKLWEEENPKSFSDQTYDLNKILKKKNYKLCIIIDEIDRLPAHHIINFLLFCRVLESFENLVCIIGIDYEQVIKKLKKESSLCLDDYEHAQSYLDKLFQSKFHVHHNKYKLIKFGADRLREIDHDKILDETLNSSDYIIQKKLEDIFGYLSTPRQIKKWLISIIANYPIIKHSLNKIDVLAFIAVTIKHPIIIDYLSKHTIKMLSEKSRLTHFIKEIYGIDFPCEENIETQIIMSSLGLLYNLKEQAPASKQDSETPLEKLISSLKVQKLNDIKAAEFLTAYLSSPTYLISLFIEGFISENQVSLYANFFGESVDLAIKAITSDDNNTYILALDLAEIIHGGSVKISGIPTLSLLNELWNRKIMEELFTPPYEIIILFCLRKLPLEMIITEGLCALSESHIISILDICDIHNNNGAYELNNFKKPMEGIISEKSMQDLKFCNIIITDFEKETIKKILEKWIEKVDSDLNSKKPEIFSQKKLISVLFRYIQWGHAIDLVNPAEKLATLIIAYLKDIKIKDSDKIYLKDILNKEKEKNKSDINKSPFKILFNNNPEIEALIA